MLARATLPAALLTLLLSACGGAPPQEPAHPPTHVDPAPPPSAEPAPIATSEPEAEPPPTLTGGPDFGDGTGEACSIWSGGPKGDAPPPKGFKSGDCPPGKECVCNAQAGYSCSGVCR